MAISRNGRKNNQHGNELTTTTKKKQKTKLRRCCVAVWLAGCDKLSRNINIYIYSGKKISNSDAR